MYTVLRYSLYGFTQLLEFLCLIADRVGIPAPRDEAHSPVA